MKSGVGCYWGCSFAGAFAYADDVVLLARGVSRGELRGLEHPLAPRSNLQKYLTVS